MSAIANRPEFLTGAVEAEVTSTPPRDRWPSRPAQAALDFGHTPRAENNRKRKAHALAVAARSLGLQPYDLAIPGGRPGAEQQRARVRRHAGVASDPSAETWALALGQLEGLARSVPGSSLCPLCGWPVLTVRTLAGKKILIDPFANAEGTVLPVASEEGPRARILPATAPRPDDEPLYRQHASTCPGRVVPAATAPSTDSEPGTDDVAVCASCGKPLDQVLAARDPSYRVHPTCPEGGAT